MQTRTLKGTEVGSALSAERAQGGHVPLDLAVMKPLNVEEESSEGEDHVRRRRERSAVRGCEEQVGAETWGVAGIGGRAQRDKKKLHCSSSQISCGGERNGVAEGAVQKPAARVSARKPAMLPRESWSARLS